MMKTGEFIQDADNDKNLFIVYYGGHGRINSERQAEWLCRRDPASSRVHWSAIQTLFAEAQSDVLILLDACAAASATARSLHGSMEAIMACGFESRAPPPGEHSFTNTLIEVLDDWINRGSFSASFLHAEILSQLKLKETKKGREGTKLEWCTTPIHINCTQNSKAPSIELCRRNILPPSFASTAKPTARVSQRMSIPSDTQLLIESCKRASIFPINIVRQFTPPHQLEAYYTQLDQQAPRLFCVDGEAALDIWEYEDNVKGATSHPLIDTRFVNICPELQATCASSISELVERIRGIQQFSQHDPKYRFL
jgi:hypothetical protein